MDVFFIFWFIAATTIIIGGSIIVAIYKGYCEAKDRHLSSSDEESILMGLFALAALPVTLMLFVLMGICHLPYLIGRLIGKHL